MSYQILVSGSRDFDDYDLMWNQMKRIIRFEDDDSVRRIIHGGAPGADSLASKFAYEEKIDLKIEGAAWGTFGSRAGVLRNNEMLSFLRSGDYVVCFPLPNSRGTIHMITEARRKPKLNVVVVEDGRLVPIPQFS